MDPNVRWGDGPVVLVEREPSAGKATSHRPSGGQTKEPSARPTGVKRRPIVSVANGRQTKSPTRFHPPRHAA